MLYLQTIEIMLLSIKMYLDIITATFSLGKQITYLKLEKIEF